jgi:hypothetical protein
MACAASPEPAPAKAGDGANRAVSVSGGTGPVTYTYGADGSRLQKSTTAGTTLYLGDGLELSGTTWTKYLPGDAKRVGTGAGAVTSWQHRDHLSSVRLITDASGVELQRAQYRPFGQQVPGLSQSKGWIGESFDPTPASPIIPPSSSTHCCHGIGRPPGQQAARLQAVCLDEHPWQ